MMEKFVIYFLFISSETEGLIIHHKGWIGQERSQD